VIGPILLSISWLLLRLEGRGLGALGIDRPRRRLAQFVLGFAFLGGVSALQQLGLSFTAKDPFVWNTALHPGALFGQMRFTLNSVLYEELVFRGYLLYQGVRFLGPTRAVLADAVAFGVYHWFSYGVIGNPVAMTYVFLLTGAFGLMWARAFVATGSVAAPIGLHLGWNVVAYVVFSAGPLGPALLVPASGADRLTVAGWPSLALNVLLPVVATSIVLWYCRALEWHERPSGSPATPSPV
jgi:membrane protease YdiL (CAAX protease family)